MEKRTKLTKNLSLKELINTLQWQEYVRFLKIYETYLKNIDHYSDNGEGLDFTLVKMEGK